MGQYKIKPHVKDKEIDMLNKEIMHGTNRIHGFRRPIQRLMPTPPAGLQVPIPQHIPSPQLQVPQPLRQELKIPEPISMGNIPQKKEKVKEEEKGVPIPI